MKRHIHFVGSLPTPLAGHPRQAMEWILDRTDGQPLTALPCDLDPDWIISYLRDLRTRTDVFEFTHRTDDYADYNHMPAGRIRPGVRLEPEHLTMNRFHSIDSIVGDYSKLRQQRPDLDGLKIQVSQPNSLDLALFALAGQAVQGGLPIRHALPHAGALTTALTHVPVFTDAIVDEVALLTKTYGSMLTWQIESPVALLSLAKAADMHAASVLAVPVAAQLASVFTRLHHIGAHTSLHLCYGDYRHTALMPPRTLSPAVVLLNALARRLRRSGTPLPVVHIPCGHGAEPAPMDPRFYTPLGRLDPEWVLIAGVVSPQSVIDSMISLRLFERAANRPAYAVATACGLGRCTLAHAEKAAAATAATATFSPHWLLPHTDDLKPDRTRQAGAGRA
ncbi:hypothetical protein [Nocardia brasiliensis]|uniref:hypothetical protein n=1 Tax=Nocardia brasiliensis TaxID=37326 RepID=UPI002455197B|nr:hypothetical protein [Nocardia brasiliensis]